MEPISGTGYDPAPDPHHSVSTLCAQTVGFIYLAYCCIVNLTYNTDYSGYGGPAEIKKNREIERDR